MSVYVGEVQPVPSRSLFWSSTRWCFPVFGSIEVKHLDDPAPTAFQWPVKFNILLWPPHIMVRQSMLSPFLIDWLNVNLSWGSKCLANCPKLSPFLMRRVQPVVVFVHPAILRSFTQVFWFRRRVYIGEKLMPVFRCLGGGLNNVIFMPTWFPDVGTFGRSGTWASSYFESCFPQPSIPYHCSGKIVLQCPIHGNVRMYFVNPNSSTHLWTSVKTTSAFDSCNERFCIRAGFLSVVPLKRFTSPYHCSVWAYPDYRITICCSITINICSDYPHSSASFNL